jgi:hypothetical protein
LLVESGLLTPRDEALVRFEAWVREAVSQSVGEDRRALERYALWRHLRRIRQLHDRGSNVHSAAHNAKQHITAAREFLAWLVARNTLLENCTQSDIDLWLTAGPTSRYTIRGFVQFTTDSRLSPPLHVLTRHARARTRRITDEDRLRWIGYYLTADTLAASTRTAALLLLVFGQPVTRIAVMQVDAVTDDPETGMTIRFATDPVLVPHPFDGVVRAHLADRSRTRTRSAAQNPFLFPGMHAGAHITRGQLKTELNAMGVDILAARNTTLDELVAAMPASHGHLSAAQRRLLNVVRRAFTFSPCGGRRCGRHSQSFSKKKIASRPSVEPAHCGTSGTSHVPTSKTSRPIPASAAASPAQRTASAAEGDVATHVFSARRKVGAFERSWGYERSTSRSSDTSSPGRRQSDCQSHHRRRRGVQTS